MDIKVGITTNTYTTKIDNHIIEIELHNVKNFYEFIKFWYNYNNNMSCKVGYYMAERNIIYNIELTPRQKRLIIDKIKLACQMQEKILKGGK